MTLRGLPGGADKSRDFYSLTYRDPTGETAVRNLLGRSVQITWESGAVIHLHVDDLRPLLALFDFQVSRKGHIWGTKKKAADLREQGDGRSQSKGIENDLYNECSGYDRGPHLVGRGGGE